MKVTSSLEQTANSCLLSGVSDDCGQLPKQQEEVRSQDHPNTMPEIHNHRKGAISDIPLSLILT
jgi:hypothetical protein